MPDSVTDPARPKHLLEGAEAPTWWASIDRRRAAVALGMSMLALPVVVLENLPDRSSAEEVEATAAAPAATAPTTAMTIAIPIEIETAAPTSTTTLAQLTSTVLATTTTAPSTTTTARPTTTTTAPPPPPTTAPPTTAPPAPPAANTESGGATWYRHAAGECAHRTIARGAVVTVTNHANGATATCTVTDRGPFGAGRIIDLDASVFEQLAPLDTGVIQVTITW